jgi:hypothetical protein
MRQGKPIRHLEKPMLTFRRRLVMILKLNDLQRALDISLATTHGAVSPLPVSPFRADHPAVPNLYHRRAILLVRSTRRRPARPPRTTRQERDHDGLDRGLRARMVQLPLVLHVRLPCSRHTIN